jgi:predicted nucleic acid-binding protein
VALVIDTGPLLAALDRSDPDHSRCRRLIDDATEARVIPAPVLVELDYWCRTKLDPAVFLRLLDDVGHGAFTVEESIDRDYRRIREVMERYPDIGFVDATVLAITERLRETKLATLDHRHFAVIRPAHTKALTLLP